MSNRCNDSNQTHAHSGPSRREALIAGAALVATPFLGGVTCTVQASADPISVKVPNFEIHDPKLCAYDKATVGLRPRQARGSVTNPALDALCYIVPGTSFGE